MSTPFSLPTSLRPGGRFDQWSPQRPAYVLCDVDGTLVDASGTVHGDVQTAAKSVIDSGLHVGFATGRGAGGLAALQQQLELPGPHVVANGGQIRSDGQVLRSWPLQPEVIEVVAGIDGVYAEFYDDNGFWVTEMRQAARPHWELLGQEPSGTLGQTQLSDVAKITAILFGERGDDDVRSVLDGLPAAVSPGTSPATPGLEYINVTHPHTDKGVALRAAAETLDIDIAATVAVGDERNDLAMLAVAGTAVAMGQAPDEVKQAAHIVGPHVEDQGLAEVLRAVMGWAGGWAGM